METPKVYVICDQNCKFEGMAKEQIHAAIMQAVTTGRIADVDAGFVTKVKTINGKYIKFFIGEQAAYDALSDAEKKDDLFAIITNDQNKAGLFEILEALETWKNDIEQGITPVPKAKEAETAATAISLQVDKENFADATDEELGECVNQNRAYCITARMGTTINEHETFFLFVASNATVIYSTRSVSGFYIRYVYVHKDKQRLEFYNSNGEEIATPPIVVIREI